MAKRRHTSARGETVDFDLLQHHNKDAVALGNANMNANGDILGRGGKIIRRVEDIPEGQMADPNAAYNEANPKSTKMVSLKGKVDDLPDVAAPATVKKSTPQVKAVAPEEETEPASEEKSKSKRKIVDSEE